MLHIHTSIIHEKKNQVAVFVALVESGEIGEFCKVCNKKPLEQT